MKGQIVRDMRNNRYTVDDLTRAVYNENFQQALNILEESNHATRAAMLAANDCYAFLWAAKKERLDVVHRLWELAPDDVTRAAMLAADDYDALRLAAEKGHLYIVKTLVAYAASINVAIPESLKIQLAPKAKQETDRFMKDVNAIEDLIVHRPKGASGFGQDVSIVINLVGRGISQDFYKSCQDSQVIARKPLSYINSYDVLFYIAHQSRQSHARMVLYKCGITTWDVQDIIFSYFNIAVDLSDPITDKAEVAIRASMHPYCNQSGQPSSSSSLSSPVADIGDKRNNFKIQAEMITMDRGNIEEEYRISCPPCAIL